jgi:hypothetical protein
LAVGLDALPTAAFFFGGVSSASDSSSLEMSAVFFRFTGADAEVDAVFAFAFVELGRDCRGLAGADDFCGVTFLVVAGVGLLPFASSSSSSSSLSETRAIGFFFRAGLLLAGVALASLFADCKTHVSILSELAGAKGVLTEPFGAAGLGLGGRG